MTTDGMVQHLQNSKETTMSTFSSGWKDTAVYFFIDSKRREDSPILDLFKYLIIVLFLEYVIWCKLHASDLLQANAYKASDVLVHSIKLIAFRLIAPPFLTLLGLSTESVSQPRAR